MKNLQDYLRLIALIVFIAPNKLKEQESKYTAGEVVWQLDVAWQFSASVTSMQVASILLVKLTSTVP